MKKSFFIISCFLLFIVFSCSKSDQIDTPQNTTIAFHNKSSYDMKGFNIYAITGSTKADLKKDTTPGTSKLYQLGAFAAGENITTAIDAKYKSFVMIFLYYNPVLGTDTYTCTILKLGTGRDAFPYVIKKDTATITLDDKMQFNIL